MDSRLILSGFQANYALSFSIIIWKTDNRTHLKVRAVEGDDEVHLVGFVRCLTQIITHVSGAVTVIPRALTVLERRCGAFKKMDSKLCVVQ